MEALYVCLFSNGHIKVGRSIAPEARVASHASRVACIGVELTRHAIFPCCDDSAAQREQMLLAKCRAAADRQFKSEWFEGLEYCDVLAWAEDCAVDTLVAAPVSGSRWSVLLADLKLAGMTQWQIATHCGCDQSTISALYSGKQKEPMYSLGEKLIALHAEQTQFQEAA